MVLRYHTNNNTPLDAHNLKDAKIEAKERWSPMSESDIVVIDSHGNTWIRPLNWSFNLRAWSLGYWYEA